MAIFIHKDIPKVQVIAHRGASGYLPEHTLAGHAMAYGMGADFLEPDLVLTKDDVPVILHDIQLDDTTDVAKKFPSKKRADGRFYAIDLTYAELKQLRAQERISLETGAPVFPGRFPLGLSDFSVPTLEELIDLLVGLNRSSGKRVGLYPELKEPLFHLEHKKDITKIVYDMFQKKKDLFKGTPLVWQCFDPGTLKRLKNEFQVQEALVLLLDDGVLALHDPTTLKKQLKEIAEYAHGIGPPLTSVFDAQGLSTRLVEGAHQHGLFVHAYTVRSDQLPSYVRGIEDFHHKIFIDEKVDAVFTDFSDTTLSFLRKNGLRSPFF
ncbi:MAG: hypothetical protein KA436_04280 [Oligoflexales bacterium]|nr:hypothetical protein [Oligoflexales bacterium]